MQTFYIIAYFTDWADIPEQVPYGKLTHINYAFLLPNPDGSLAPLGNVAKLAALVEQAHAHQVKVLISVGGWGLDAQFEALAADAAARDRFVREVVGFMQANHMDGIDIDWEYPDAGASARNFAALMHALRVELAPRGKLLTAAVAADGSNGDGIPSSIFDDVDFLNLMVYDGDSGAGHSPYSYALASLEYWSRRGLPPGKTVLGVPFYSRPGEVPYRQLVQADPSAAHTDQAEYQGATQFYNGIPTIQKKARLALERAAGVMFWTLGDDAPGDASLLNAIYEAAHTQ